MDIGYLRFALFLINGFVCFRLFGRASADTVDLLEDNPPGQLAMVTLIHNDNEISKLEYDSEDNYYDSYELSGEYELEFPRVAFSTKSKNMPMTPDADGGVRKRKGLGKKRNPCLKKYKDFCIHGVCHYLRKIGEPSCICTPGYYGERCLLFSLPVTKDPSSYERTVALVVVGVVFSLVCLAVIAVVVVIRYRKKVKFNHDNEDKVKLETAANP
ncbi:hypothetical protein DPEC_G00227640 [Dallia pectoralis]|uniref:Uncharacterized protein n=1 Tax=Dallia pectoralis TaxID=75939 RepID=A0ACC2G1C8_DALPE|nr:hypothetical protein DPEC_G00227640 [Dallia pectoralis]